MKTTFIAILFSIGTTYILQAQQSETTVNFKKHAVGFNYSNDITSQFTSYDFFIPEGDKHASYGYAAALLYQYRPVKWFSVETGVEYNSTKKYVTDGFPYDAYSLMFIDFAPDARFDYGQTINRWAMPLNLR